MGVVHTSGVREGLVSLWSLHTTCAVFINENQSALHADIKQFLELTVARAGKWMHNDPEHSDCDRNNADAHLRAMLLGHSMTLQVTGGELVLGQWQRVLAAELDGPRIRSVRVQVQGRGLARCAQRLASLGLTDIADKLDAGVRLTFDDGMRLFDCPDTLLSAGWPIASARSGTARAPTTTSTSGSRRPTSASPAASSARSRG